MVMKNYSTLFLIGALITGIIGFAGFSFGGIEIVRVLSLIFTDLFVVSLIAKAFFPGQQRLKYQEVEK